MISRRRKRDGELVQGALELRHDVEQLAERCQRLYEEANELVVRLRTLSERAAAAAPADGAARHGAVRRWSSACPRDPSDA
jgi:hypothetical protein